MTLLFFILFLMTTPIWAGDASVDVPVGHPVYALLDRLAARGEITRPSVRPLSRLHVAQLLGAVRDRTNLSPTERGIVDRFAAEFAGELKALGEEAPSRRGRLRGDPLWSWCDSVVSVAVEPVFRQRVIAKRGSGFQTETVSQTYVGGRVYGQYHRLGFSARHFEAREWSSQGRTARDDVLARPLEDVQLKGNFADFREGVFQLVWANAWLRLDAGKGATAWGPGRTGNLLLGDHAPSYGLFRLRVSHGRVHYTHLAGSLHARPGLIDTTRRWIDNGHVRIFLREKRLAAHRLDIVFDRVAIGLHEAVIYGDRGYEPLYFLPVTLFAAVQNHLDNRDNLVMGADVSYRPGGGLELYGALFFDDLAKFSPGAFSNKFAFQIGGVWVDPLGLRDTDLEMEYVRIEPFVYSHNCDINTYEHYDALLGHPLGPNADLWHAQIAHRLSPSFNAFVRFERERQGENPIQADGHVENVGGDAQLGRRPTDAAERDFMAGDVIKQTRFGFGVVFEPVANWSLRGVYDRRRISDMGRHTTAHTWSATMDVDFY